MNSVLTYVFTFSFSLLVACFAAASVSGAVLFLTSRRINAAFQHPYLEKRAFHQYPFSIQAAITLDYFFRISFPRTTWSLIGDANKLLKNVDPRDLPLAVKWPVVGFWGGCLLGIFAMVTVWTSLLLTR